MKDKKQNILVLLLAIVLILILVIGTITDRNEKKENMEEYNTWIKEKEINKKNKEDSDKKDNEEKVVDKSNNNFYTKLSKKEKVKVLILGDGIALSEGRNSENGIWEHGLSYIIKNTYGCENEVVSLAKNKSKVSDGIKVVENNDIKDYDLIVTCFGHNDSSEKISLDKFRENYEELINNIKEANNNAIIIPVVESTLDKENVYRKELIEILKEKSILYADTKLAFEKSGILEVNLKNNELPNDTGYQIYTQTISEVIKSGLEENK